MATVVGATAVVGVVLAVAGTVLAVVDVDPEAAVVLVFEHPASDPPTNRTASTATAARFENIVSGSL